MKLIAALQQRSSRALSGLVRRATVTKTGGSSRRARLFVGVDSAPMHMGRGNGNADGRPVRSIGRQARMGSPCRPPCRRQRRASLPPMRYRRMGRQQEISLDCLENPPDRPVYRAVQDLLGNDDTPSPTRNGRRERDPYRRCPPALQPLRWRRTFHRTGARIATRAHEVTLIARNWQGAAQQGYLQVLCKPGAMRLFAVARRATAALPATQRAEMASRATTSRSRTNASPGLHDLPCRRRCICGLVSTTAHGSNRQYAPGDATESVSSFHPATGGVGDPSKSCAP